MILDCHTYRIIFPDDFGNYVSELSTLSDESWESRFYFLESDIIYGEVKQ